MNQTILTFSRDLFIEKALEIPIEGTEQQVTPQIFYDKVSMRLTFKKKDQFCMFQLDNPDLKFNFTIKNLYSQL